MTGCIKKAEYTAQRIRGRGRGVHRPPSNVLGCLAQAYAPCRRSVWPGTSSTFADHESPRETCAQITAAIERIPSAVPTHATSSLKSGSCANSNRSRLAKHGAQQPTKIKNTRINRSRERVGRIDRSLEELARIKKKCRMKNGRRTKIVISRYSDAASIHV